MNRMIELSAKIEALTKEIEALKQEHAALRLEELRKVAIKKNDYSITLRFNGRSVNVKRNSYGRFAVKEGKRVLDSDYLGNLHDLRFDIATSRI